MITTKDIIMEDDPLIRQKSVPVEMPLSDEDRATVMAMYEHLVASQDPELSEKYGIRPGVGMAAIQIGIPKRMCAIYVPEFDEDGEMISCDQYALINPRIVSHSVKRSYLRNGEGCLSVPEDQAGIVPRYLKVTVTGYDALTDQDVRIVARNFLAICLQHELDHFEGILYYDHFDPEDPNRPIPDAKIID
ncbi:MAG: peptide deformylase [Erysipelotrichaceae bacterium]|nr:peptide deformylase [Erysipelotrichaceae bacterium]